MIIHTLIYHFPAEMTRDDQESFFREVEAIMTEQGKAERAEHRPHLPISTDDTAPVWAATAIEEVHFPDLDALAATSALPAMHEFMAGWQKRFPYKVVWANHKPLP